MKALIQKIYMAFLLTAIGIFSTMNINAQWVNKASGFSSSRNLDELIAVNDKVAWGIAGEAFLPVWEVPPFNDFTRTTDGGNHWVAGKVSAYPDYILVGIA